MALVRIYGFTGPVIGFCPDPKEKKRKEKIGDFEGFLLTLTLICPYFYMLWGPDPKRNIIGTKSTAQNKKKYENCPYF